MRDLELYLGLERLMLELDADGDSTADDIRDLMDPLWYRLPPEEIALLDNRGSIDPRGLFPVRLPVPHVVGLPAPTISGRTFDAPGRAGWRSPVDWRDEAA